MELQLLGQTIALDPNLESYNSYRIMFQEEAGRVVKRFKELYQANTSLEMVIKNVPDQISQCVHPPICRCVQVLIDHGALSIDEERFLDLYPDILSPAKDAYVNIQEQYAEIVLSEEEKDAYRTARRQGHARWQGGGFGLSGALKGAAQAGALNMVTGAGHMLFNGVAKIGSSIAASSKIDRIFKDENTEKSLVSGLARSIFNIHFALVDCLNKTGVDEQTIHGMIENEAREEAAAILRNVSRLNNLAQQRTALIQSFQLNPYQTDWYRKALEIFGDQDGSLERAENYFGLSVVHNEKKRQLNRFAQGLPIGSDSQAKLAVEKLEAEKARLCFSGETEQTKAVLDAANRFDVEYRTVEGITFATREEADASRAELRAIQEIEQHIDYHNLASIAEGEGKMETLSSPLAISRREALQEKWRQLDAKQRSVDTSLPERNPILCESREQAQQLQDIIDELNVKLNACGKGPSAEQPLQQLQSEVAAMDLQAEAKDYYQSEIGNRLAAIDLALRTTLGKEYPSREAANEAQQLYDQLQSAFIKGNPRKNGDKLRSRVEAADFSEKTKAELLEQLYQRENSREIKAAIVIGRISYAILIAIMVLSFFFPLTGTPALVEKDVKVFGVSLMLRDIQPTYSLRFMEGLINGLVVFGRSFGGIFVDGFHEYIGGFDSGLIGNLLWGIIGIFWVFIKQFFLGLARYCVSLVLMLFQAASVRYYIGYIIGSAIPIAVSQFAFDKDEEEENVSRIKDWTVKKIFLALLVVVAVGFIIFFFARQEL